MEGEKGSQPHLQASLHCSSNLHLPACSGGIGYQARRYRIAPPPRPNHKINDLRITPYLGLRRGNSESSRPDAPTNHVELRLPDAPDDSLTLPAVVRPVRVFELQVVPGSRRHG